MNPPSILARTARGEGWGGGICLVKLARFRFSMMGMWGRGVRQFVTFPSRFYICSIRTFFKIHKKLAIKNVRRDSDERTFA